MKSNPKHNIKGESMEEKEIAGKLKMPFPASKIHWRVGATNTDKSQGIALAYIDARDLMERLDEVVGPFNWQARYPWSDSKRLVCEIGIKVGDEWIWKSNGAGDTHVEAEKGAFSDAFKRAGVLWGVAQYLYDLPNTWVDLKKQGKSYVITPLAKRDLTLRLAKWQEQFEKDKELKGDK
jgi:hypothetical protein